MQLTHDEASDNLIQSYDAGKIKINNEWYTHSIIVMPNQIIAWPVSSIDALQQDDILPLLKYMPDVIILGTGTQLRFPQRKLIEFINKNNVGIEVMATSAACRTYNVLLSEGRNILAALII